MAHMAFVRSPHAHARVLGVRGALLTAAEIAGQRCRRGSTRRPA